jgi:hypothetical protein
MMTSHIVFKKSLFVLLRTDVGIEVIFDISFRDLGTFIDLQACNKQHAIKPFRMTPLDSFLSDNTL